MDSGKIRSVSLRNTMGKYFLRRGSNGYLVYTTKLESSSFVQSDHNGSGVSLCFCEVLIAACMVAVTATMFKIPLNSCFALLL